MPLTLTTGGSFCHSTPTAPAANPCKRTLRSKAKSAAQRTRCCLACWRGSAADAAPPHPTLEGMPPLLPPHRQLWRFQVHQSACPSNLAGMRAWGAYAVPTINHNTAETNAHNHTPHQGRESRGTAGPGAWAAEEPHRHLALPTVMVLLPSFFPGLIRFLRCVVPTVSPLPLEALAAVVSHE